MFDDEFEDFLFPELTLETDDITMNLVVKKDYSYLDTIEERKKEFLDDLKSFIKEFDGSPDSIDFFKYFDDYSEYKGKTIHFNKRAILLVNDLFYMSKTINKNIGNVNNMLGCADYGIPRTLRTYGVLEYSDELSEKVDNEIEIESNSEIEVEIRANMLYALELMKKKLKEAGKEINSVELDNLIWQMGRKKKNILPYHHTTTIFY